MRTVTIDVANGGGWESICLGLRGENEATQVIFDISSLAETFGAGVTVLLNKRPSDTAPYPVTVQNVGNTVVWNVSDEDTYEFGFGQCQLLYYVGSTLAKSFVFSTYVGEDIVRSGGTEPPDPYETWIETLTELGAATQENASIAAESASAASEAATTATNMAESARNSEDAASGYATDAAQSYNRATAEALKSEGFAVATQNNVPVGNDSPYYHKSSKDYANQANYYQALAADSANFLRDCSATATTLESGSPATASYSNGVFSFGIPAGEDCSDMIADDFSTSVDYGIGDYVIHNGSLYCFTAAHAAGAWDASHATAVQLAEDVSNLKSAVQTAAIPTVYWGKDGAVGPFTTIPSATQTGNVVKFNCTNGAQSATNGYYVLSGATITRLSNGTALNNQQGNVDLIAGNWYRMRYKLLSGTISQTNEAGSLKISVRYNKGSGSELAHDTTALPDIPNSCAVEFQWKSAYGKAYLCVITKSGLLCSNATIEIILDDITEQKKQAAGNSASLSVCGDGIPAVFVNGSRDSSGTFFRRENRVTTQTMFKIHEQVTYNIAPGFAVRRTSFNSDGSVIANNNKLEWEMTLQPDVFYHLTIYRATESETETADIWEFINAVKKSTSGQIFYIPAEFQLGSRDTNGNYADNTQRITTISTFKPARRITYAIPQGYLVRIISFDDNGNKLAHSNNIEGSVAFNPDRNYHVVIYKADETGTYTADIQTFYKAIKRTVPQFSKHLRIMVFGHSYSADSWQYVPFILKNYGISCEIYLYYRGNDSINRLVEEWETSSSTGTDDYGISHIRRYCHVDTRYNDAWDGKQGVEGYSAKMVLETAAAGGALDLITLQTAPTEVYFTKSPGSGDPRKGYEPWVRKAIDLINASYSEPYALGWFCSYTRILPYEGDQSKGYPAVTGAQFDNRVGALKAAETIYKTEPFNMVIPAAAAVFNARTNSSLASTSVSALGNLWFSDAVHLQDGIPCYITNLTVIQSIFNTFFNGLSVLGEQTRLTDSMISDWNGLMPSIHGDVLSSSEALYDLAQKCAVAACQHPFDITPIYDTSDTTELEMYDTHSDRYWADSLIDTSGITSGNITEQSGDA